VVVVVEGAMPNYLVAAVGIVAYIAINWLVLYLAGIVGL
jgi:hypothetical protein